MDLLEHTTGWDDMHLREYAKDAKGMNTREGLDYDHHSRTRAGNPAAAWPTATPARRLPPTLWKNSQGSALKIT